MEDFQEFRKRVEEAKGKLSPETFLYDESEFWMIRPLYEYIKFYAYDHRLFNAALALPLARGLHNGSHRKSSITRDGKPYRLPYVFHCFRVCRMLIDLHLPLSRDEEDIVLASALCHDMVEDLPFPKKGLELTEDFGLDPRIYETVRKVSKRRDFTPEEEKAFFRGIQEDRFALLVKLSDRSHNVEDLYNMSFWKIHEYIGETRTFFLPMGQYGLQHYPDLRMPLGILIDKITLLTDSAEDIVERCEMEEKVLVDEVLALRKENEELRGLFRKIRMGELNVD